MTTDQKKVLYALGVFVGFKALLFGSIIYANKVSRDLRKGHAQLSVG